MLVWACMLALVEHKMVGEVHKKAWVLHRKELGLHRTVSVEASVAEISVAAEASSLPCYLPLL